MKRLVVTWVVMAASASPVYAQSSVRISGSVYGGVGLSGGAPSRTHMAGPASIMFSGKEDLGGGNAVLFKLENGFNATTGTNASATTFFDKQAFVGLQGDWGTVRAGRVYTPAFATLALVADPSATNSMLTSTTLMESHGVRLNNGVIYNSPGFDPWTYKRTGWYGAVAHYFGEAPTGGMSRNSANGVNLGYGKGPLVVELSHQRTNLYTSATQDVDSHSTLLAANYDFGPATGYIAYSDNNARNLVSTLKTKNSNDILLGVSVLAGDLGLVTVVVIRKNDKLPANSDGTMVGATYDYLLSKRTKFTVGYARMHNSNPAKPYKLANSYTGTNAATGGHSAVQLGITHKF